MADLESMSREDLTVFRFIKACDDKRLQEKIFDLKRKDATAIKEVIAQYDRQKKAEAALRAKAPIAAVKSKKNDQRSTYNPDQGIECSSCGGRHLQRDCRVFKERMICNYCGRTGHLSRMCFSRQGKPGPARGNRQIRAVTDEEPVPQDSWVNRPNLKISHPHGSFTFHTFPETGSAATLIAAGLARKNNIRPTKPCLIVVCGDPVSTKGTALITLHISTSSTSSNVVITPLIKREIIIRRDDLKELGVIPKQFPAPVFFISENQYSDMREMLIKDNPEFLTDDLPNSSMDTGCIPMKIYLTLGEKMPLRISTARQIPLHWREKAERIVKKLDGGVLMRQDDPTEWCALGFFLAKKNSDLRLVVDYTKLNKYVRHPVHTFPWTQEILSGIDPSSKIFAKLDATQGYHQVFLDEDSSKLTTFLLPSGRFRFLRSPMGLSCSSDEFCRRSDKIIEGLQGFVKLVDDILVQAPDIQTLQARIN